MNTKILGLNDEVAGVLTVVHLVESIVRKAEHTVHVSKRADPEFNAADEKHFAEIACHIGPTFIRH